MSNQFRLLMFVVMAWLTASQTHGQEVIITERHCEQGPTIAITERVVLDKPLVAIGSVEIRRESDYYVFFTARWCSHCRKWKESGEQKKLEASSFQVVTIDVDEHPEWADKVTSLPEFWRCDRARSVRIARPWTGFQTAATLLRPELYATTTSRRLASRIDLEAWLSANDRSEITTTVEPVSRCWDHLVNEHGFSRSQVSGMSLDTAMRLHDAAHRGTVTPYLE